MSKDVVFNEVKEKPEEFKAALAELNAEVMLYKDGIVAGTLHLTPETVVRLQEAIKDLADQTSVTIDDLTYHTERLTESRLETEQKGGGADGTANH